MIRLCVENDLDTMLGIINDSARAYQGRIPDDRYRQPYMPREELLAEIAAGIAFYGYEDDGQLVAIMGVQDRGPVLLIRHAYTRTDRRGQGLGSHLLEHLLELTDRPVLVGTWRDAEWAIRFYQKHGFQLVSQELKDTLLEKYWSIPNRQIETSVVLVNETYQRTLASGQPGDSQVPQPGPGEGGRTVEVYLVQHGEATSKQVDPARPLTKHGIEAVEQVAALAARLGLAPGQIRHSGKTRAGQTAEILGRALSPPNGIIEVSGLAPRDDVQPVAAALEQETQPVMLVGHLPFLARLAGLLLAGDAENHLVRFRTGGIVCLSRDQERWQVAWILTPDMARAG